MSDITKCQGTDCPIKERCHRYLAISDDKWQSWFAEIPGKWDDTGDFKCDMYWGSTNQQILDNLKQILNGEHNDRCKSNI